MWVRCLVAGFAASLDVSVAAEVNALLFIDSSQIEQQSIVVEADRALYYSPTMREQLRVQVIDVNPGAHPFNGLLDYSLDRRGEWVAKYRPGRLPYLICLKKGEETHRQTLYKSSEIRICINKE